MDPFNKLKEMKILLIDDDEWIRDSLSIYFESRGCYFLFQFINDLIFLIGFPEKFKGNVDIVLFDPLDLRCVLFQFPA